LILYCISDSPLHVAYCDPLFPPKALRLLMELFFFGVHQDPSLLMRALRLAAPPALVLPVRSTSIPTPPPQTHTV
jgi:hypothetical protein